MIPDATFEIGMSSFQKNLINTMKKSLIFCAAVFTLATLAMSAHAQDSRKFSASGFTKLSMGNAFKIEVRQGSGFSVSTSGRKEDLDDLESSVKGGTLHLGYKGNNWNKNRKTVNVDITMPSLEGVDFSGASKANVASFTGVKTMDIEVSGASGVTMALSAPKVSFDLSGASSLTLTGQGDILTGKFQEHLLLKEESFPAKPSTLMLRERAVPQ
jgi:hypothetical protein